MISKSFLKSSFIYSFIGALPLASSFILLPFYTAYLSTDQFGMLAIYIIFTQLFQILINFALDNFIPIIHANHSKENELKKEYISSGFFLLIIFGLCVVVLMTALGPLLFQFLKNVVYAHKVVSDFSFYPWGFYCVLTAFFNSVFKSYVNLLINQQRPVRFLWCNLTNFFLTISISIAGIYWFPNTLIGPMYGRLLSGAGIFVIAGFLFYKEFGFKFYRKHLKEIWQFCYPMVIYFLLVWVLGNLYPYILLFYSNATMVGIFDFAIKCTSVLDFLQNGLAAAILPKVFEIWRVEKKAVNTPEVNRYYNGFTLVNLLVLPVFVLLIPPVVRLFVHNEVYYISFMLLPLLTIGYISRTLLAMFSSPTLFFKKTKVYPKVYAVTALLQVGLSLVTIRYFGILGAAITFALVKFIQVLFFYLQSRKLFSFKFSAVKQLWLPLFYIVVVVIALPFSMHTFSWWIAILQIVLVYTASFLAFRKEILFTYRKKKDVIWHPWRLLKSSGSSVSD
jgi:O-antigen/teichoic acid export membrane protein